MRFLVASVSVLLLVLLLCEALPAYPKYDSYRVDFNIWDFNTNKTNLRSTRHIDLNNKLFRQTNYKITLQVESLYFFYGNTNETYYLFENDEQEWQCLVVEFHGPIALLDYFGMMTPVQYLGKDVAKSSGVLADAWSIVNHTPKKDFNGKLWYLFGAGDTNPIPVQNVFEGGQVGVKFTNFTTTVQKEDFVLPVPKSKCYK